MTLARGHKNPDADVYINQEKDIRTNNLSLLFVHCYNHVYIHLHKEGQNKVQ